MSRAQGLPKWGLPFTASPSRRCLGFTFAGRKLTFRNGNDQILLRHERVLRDEVGKP